jgi:hypothetical protein
VCRHPFEPFIYHGQSVNARLTLIGRARRSIGRIRRAGGLDGRLAPQTTLVWAQTGAISGAGLNGHVLQEGRAHAATGVGGIK